MSRQQVMRVASVLVGGLLAASSVRAQVQPISHPRPMHTESTAAFVGAARLHADSLARLPATAQAGLWIVQDTKGRLISSGILSPFPTTFSSDHIADVVPGAAGLSPLEFGFALTPAERNRPAVRAAFVTVRPHS